MSTFGVGPSPYAEMPRFSRAAGVADSKKVPTFASIQEADSYLDWVYAEMMRSPISISTATNTPKDATVGTLWLASDGTHWVCTASNPIEWSQVVS